MNTQKTYECRTTTNPVRKLSLDGVAIWDRPEEPATLAVAFYADSTCGKYYKNPRKTPSAIVILDKNVLRGLHIANFKALGDQARIRTQFTGSYMAVKVQKEVRLGGMLYGIPTDRLPGSVVYWATDGTRRVAFNAVEWVNGYLYENIVDPAYIHQFMKEIVEKVVNNHNIEPTTDVSVRTSTFLNALARLPGAKLQLELPNDVSFLDLKLDTEVDDSYGQKKLPNTIPLEEVLPQEQPEITDQNSLNLISILPNPRPGIVDELSLENNPGSGSPGSLSGNEPDIFSEFLQGLQELEQEAEQENAIVTTSTVDKIASLEVPRAPLQETFDQAPDKTKWLRELENSQRRNMGALLRARDLYYEYEEKKQGVPPGTYAQPSAYKDEFPDDLAPSVEEAFSKVNDEDKERWFEFAEAQQKWNMRALRLAEEIYREWLDSEQPQATTENVPQLQDIPAEVLIEEVENDFEFVEPYPNTANVDFQLVSDVVPNSQFQSPDFIPEDQAPQNIELDSAGIIQAQKSDAQIELEPPLIDLQPTGDIIHHIQLEGLDPEDPMIIQDFFKHFDPNSRTFKEIMAFNPRLMENVKENLARILGTPNFAAEQHYPPELFEDVWGAREAKLLIDPEEPESPFQPRRSTRIKRRPGEKVKKTTVMEGTVDPSLENGVAEITEDFDYFEKQHDTNRRPRRATDQKRQGLVTNPNGSP
ncbi:hypothetical protein ABW20_dc0104244 [Dactylellina cionopaga]|nr:hypothetical protein ABW20_dc0104244 [Dactylellina cionopaga]